MAGQWAVVGLGQAGLPLAVALANKGVEVVGCDNNPAVLEAVAAGQPPLWERGLPAALATALEGGTLKLVAAGDLSSAGPMEGYFICVGTPLQSAPPILNPLSDWSEVQPPTADLSAVLAATDLVAQCIAESNSSPIVVYRSTMPPTTTQNILQPRLQAATGLSELGVGFSPERMKAGHALTEVLTLPQIVGATDLRTRDLLKELFTRCGASVVELSSPTEAELVKLTDNTYRDLNLAFVNQLAKLCDTVGADVFDVIAAASKGYSRNHLLKPGVGVGGSCLPKDPYMMLAGGAEVPFLRQLLLAGRAANLSMPQHALDLLERVFEQQGLELAQVKLALLGAAFRPGTSDLRGSIGIKLGQLLQKQGCDVVLVDPHCHRDDFRDLGLDFQSSLDPLLEAPDLDALVLITEHEEFVNLQTRLALVPEKMRTPIIFDGRGTWQASDWNDAGFIFVGLGRGGIF